MNDINCPFQLLGPGLTNSVTVAPRREFEPAAASRAAAVTLDPTSGKDRS